MVLYEKTPAVDQDWQDIAEYTFENFGEDQLRKYTRNLNKCLENMVNNKGHFKEIAIRAERAGAGNKPTCLNSYMTQL